MNEIESIDRIAKPCPPPRCYYCGALMVHETIGNEDMFWAIAVCPKGCSDVEE